MDIYDKDLIINLKNEIVAKIKKDNLVIDENKTFAEIITLIPVKNRQKQLKIDLILENPEERILFEQLKDLPFYQVKKIYMDRDSLIDDKKEDLDEVNTTGSKRDNLIKHLFKIQTLIQLYEENKISEFIRKTEMTINSVAKKREIKEIITTIKDMADNTIEEVLSFADEKKICRKDDKFLSFVDNNKYLFNRVKQVKFKEFQNLYKYLEGYTPFSTQHKIKGAEYDNVFVILDNGNWNNYNFARLFGDGEGSERVLLRTQKIFYVCCTRAKENLIVFYHDPSPIIIKKAEEWFGEQNVCEC